MLECGVGVIYAVNDERVTNNKRKQVGLGFSVLLYFHFPFSFFFSFFN